MQRQLGELQQKDHANKKLNLEEILKGSFSVYAKDGLCGSVSDPMLFLCDGGNVGQTLQDEMCESKLNAVKGAAERLRLAEQEAHC